MSTGAKAQYDIRADRYVVVLTLDTDEAYWLADCMPSSDAGRRDLLEAVAECERLNEGGDS